ncbi:MAG TPA: SDR family oxidoreductase [Thermoanaerobaculia bacterium]|nr:SDR family oxidoreductase [Thermoanaerobaculia bacterium]
MQIPDLLGQTVTVTGGAGFIGSHLVDALIARGARVRVLDDLSTGRRENLASAAGAGGRVELLEGDLRDAGACRRACDGASLVFHQAALGSVPRSLADPATTIEVNIAGTAHLFAAARDAGVRRLVYASSSSVYGDNRDLPAREGGEGSPLSPYALSKAAGEQLAAVFTRCYGLELIGLRYFNVYGPRQDPQGPYAAVVPRFFAACLAGEAPVIYGDGEQTRELTYIEDVVTANLLAAGAPASACGRAYNVAGGAPTAIVELARRVREVVGDGREPRHEAPRPGEPRHSHADLTAAREALGYVPSTPLAEGLRSCLDYYGS